MREFFPVVRAHAMAAAIFGALLALMFPLSQKLPQTYQTPILLAFTFAYVWLMNKRLSRTMAPPEFLRPKKGSHKKERGSGWRVARWIGGMVVAGVVVQVAVFAGAYSVVRAIMSALGW